MSSSTDTKRVRAAWGEPPRDFLTGSLALLTIAASLCWSACSVDTLSVDCVTNNDCGAGETCVAGGICEAFEVTRIPDPAPSFNQPGDYACQGGPTFEMDAFEFDVMDEDFFHLIGRARDADENGIWYLRGPEGQAMSGRITASPSDVFDLGLPIRCGVNTLKLLWSNGVCTSVYVATISSENVCRERDIQLTLLWDEAGENYDLHLIQPGGELHDSQTSCSSSNCVGQGFGPDWGFRNQQIDDPWKDRNDEGALGPENINLQQAHDDGNYRVVIEHWAGDSDSEGRLFLVVNEEWYVAEVFGFPAKHLWQAATIAWPEGRVSTSSETFDCTDNWTNGCRR